MPTATNNAAKPFGSDRPLLYNVAPWNSLGYAVPNFGHQIGTVNAAIHRLADEVGKAQLQIMTHPDAARTQPPSMNTIQRIGKLLNRVNAILAGRQKSPDALLLEEIHASADVQPWLIHPVPHFVNSTVKNSWLREYNRLVMFALTNIYQHSDNNIALTITQAFATQIWAYFREVAILMGTELLGLKAADITAPAFIFDDKAYAGYATIETRTMSFERLDTAGPIQSRPVETDLYDFFRGIPANLIISSLAEYPATPGILEQGSDVGDDASAPGTADGSGIVTNGLGAIGQPAV